ncbi:hypothetical protein EDD11_008197 [Mortierella claussenii]|nr:hypothetical protein EDD11_008197 [Mortierella claussenii]
MADELSLRLIAQRRVLDQLERDRDAIEAQYDLLTDNRDKLLLAGSCDSLSFKDPRSLLKLDEPVIHSIWMDADGDMLSFLKKLPVARMALREKMEDFAKQPPPVQLTQLTETILRNRLKAAEIEKDEKVRMAEVAKDERVKMAEIAKDEKVRLAEIAKDERVKMAAMAKDERLRMAMIERDVRVNMADKVEAKELQVPESLKEEQIPREELKTEEQIKDSERSLDEPSKSLREVKFDRDANIKVIPDAEIRLLELKRDVSSLNKVLAEKETIKVVERKQKEEIEENFAKIRRNRAALTAHMERLCQLEERMKSEEARRQSLKLLKRGCKDAEEAEEDETDEEEDL